MQRGADGCTEKGSISTHNANETADTDTNDSKFSNGNGPFLCRFVAVRANENEATIMLINESVCKNTSRITKTDNNKIETSKRRP